MALGRSADVDYDPYALLDIKCRGANCRWNDETTSFVAALMLGQSDPYNYKYSVRDDDLINEERERHRLSDASPNQIKNKAMHLKMDLKLGRGIFARALGQTLARQHAQVHEKFSNEFYERTRNTANHQRTNSRGFRGRLSMDSSMPHFLR